MGWKSFFKESKMKYLLTIFFAITLHAEDSVIINYHDFGFHIQNDIRWVIQNDMKAEMEQIDPSEYQHLIDEGFSYIGNHAFDVDAYYYDDNGFNKAMVTHRYGKFWVEWFFDRSEWSSLWCDSYFRVHFYGSHTSAFKIEYRDDKIINDCW